jgi:hypothetical protein
MTQVEIIEMAKQAGWSKEYLAIGDERLEVFAKLVAQYERDRIFGELLKMHEKASSRHNYYLNAVVTIRARGQA